MITTRGDDRLGMIPQPALARGFGESLGPQGGTLGWAWECGEYLVQALEYLVHLGLGEDPRLLQAPAIGLAALHVHLPEVLVIGDGRVELLHDGVHCAHKPATPQLPTLARRA